MSVLFTRCVSKIRSPFTVFKKPSTFVFIDLIGGTRRIRTGLFADGNMDILYATERQQMKGLYAFYFINSVNIKKEYNQMKNEVF